MIARDHTRLVVRENKLWKIENIPLPGVVIPRAFIAGAGLVIVGGVGWLLSVAVRVPMIMLWGFVAGAAAAGFLYWASGRRTNDDMPIHLAAVVLADWWVRQPKHINGFTRDREPDRIRWQLITWDPTAERWHAAFNQHQSVISAAKEHQC